MNKLIPMEHYRELVWQRAINALLLRVLKDTAEQLAAWFEMADPSDVNGNDKAILAAARAAIAKAEGRQP